MRVRKMNANKVLIVVNSFTQNNGVTNCMMNYYDELVTHSSYVDFLVLKKVNSPYEKKVVKNGGKVFFLPKVDSYISKKKMRFLDEIMKQRYDVVHVNVPNHNGTAVLLSAYKNKVPVRVYHSHAQKLADTYKNKIKSFVFDNLCSTLSNAHLACSTAAGNEIFGIGNFKILPNGIHAEKYVFNKENRNQIRESLGLTNAVVVGVVGRLSYLKNPFFSVRVFAEFQKLVPDARLLWLGAGELDEPVRELAKELEIADKCLFMGSVGDVEKWYSAMDILLFPSKMEGLGMVAVEAQTSGLFCFASDRVPEDTKLTENIRYYSLNETPLEWAQRMMNEKVNWEKTRTSHLDEINEAGYNIDSSKITLVTLYDGFLNAVHR
jgi:glycosyltransferase involved in cell wall biosynthesis